MLARDTVLPIPAGGLDRFADFLAMTIGQTYPETPSEPHTSVTGIMLDKVLDLCALRKPGRILDVGCGQGPALDVIRERGYHAVGITVNDEDLRVCREKGHEVYKMEQSFLDFPPGSFDLIWARHCVEHSVMPFFTLYGFSAILQEGGFLYLEVPAPDTACHHEQNVNHYSVLTRSSWDSLLKRCGFAIIWENVFEFKVPAGDDAYLMFVCQKRPMTKK